MNRKTAVWRKFRHLTRLVLATIISVGGVYGAEILHPHEETMQMLQQPLLVEFPLRGVWMTPHSPGSKVPSHGTSQYGETYAIDFVMINEHDAFKKFYQASVLKYLTSGVSLEQCYGWGQPIYSPLDGEVIAIHNDIPERQTLRLLKDLKEMRAKTRTFSQGKGTIESLAGNYVLIKHSATVYALLAHLKQGSVIVEPGQKIVAQQLIGQVGHSGNSMLPHLHMQFMDQADVFHAHGLPFRFRQYERKHRKQWEIVSTAVPTTHDVVRF